MKKILSLLFVLVLTVACISLTAMAAEKPATCDLEDAIYKVETAAGDAFYIEGLDSTVSAWAVEQPGGVTITALKDHYFAPLGLVFPKTWDPANPVTIDFNGYKIQTASAEYAMIVVNGNGNLTLKNGIITHSQPKNFINLGLSTPANNTDGVYHNPTLTFENICLVQTDTGNRPVLESKNVKQTINIKNSTLWTANPDFFAVLNFDNCNEEIVVNMEGSILYSPNNRCIRIGQGSTGKLTINAYNSSFGNSNGNVQSGINNCVINGLDTKSGLGGEAVGGQLVAGWNVTTATGATLTGVGTVFGEAPSMTTVPAPRQLAVIEPPKPVANPDAAIAPAQTEITLDEGATGTISATVTPKFEDSDKTITYTADNDCVTVNADGTFTANKAGTAVVTLTTAEGLSATVTITVNEVVAPVDPAPVDPVDPAPVDPAPADPVDPAPSDDPVTPAPAEKKDSSVGMIVIIAVAAVVVIALVVVLVLKKKKVKAE
ncbi:MAG: Ig-like domain-containing protein [Oscillospiraceae bacterium]|nr:Ig-like domain-containing protein [Oscillospiraceae bacterium]